MKKNKISLLIICVLAFAVAVYFFPKGRNNSNGEGLSHFRVETFKGAAGWAYRIYEGDTIRIEQLYMPGIEGTSGFASEELARKTGDLVRQKLDRNIFPPTITPNELDSLGVKF
ncbi:DUF4907 domain-containing protein [Dyadobacter luticola]|uniref:DUF4907 domain-containing protein n=1 Tax=Dyadobacter luticola TaxID=1979387 RepID=A0A5R9L6J6_9BACT|nr:DUF4907 domain-containing protein [Dyadobacter luticola]